MGDIFRVGKISNIFLGVFEIPDIVLGRTEDAGLDPKVGRKNESTPPPWGIRHSDIRHSYRGGYSKPPYADDGCVRS